MGHWKTKALERVYGKPKVDEDRLLMRRFLRASRGLEPGPALRYPPRRPREIPPSDSNRAEGL